jgi:hypothetical protein
MDNLIFAVIFTSAFIIWLTCFVKGFLHGRFPNLEMILTLSTVYGCSPALLAIGIFLSIRS